MGYEADLETSIREYIQAISKAYRPGHGEPPPEIDAEGLRRALVPLLRGRFYAYLMLRGGGDRSLVRFKANELAMAFLDRAATEILDEIDQGFSLAVEAGDDRVLSGWQASTTAKEIASNAAADIDYFAEGYVADLPAELE